MGDFGMLRHQRVVLCTDPEASSFFQPLLCLNALMGYSAGIGVPMLSRFLFQGPGVTG